MKRKNKFVFIATTVISVAMTGCVDMKRTGYAVDATYTTSCAPPPMMEDLGLGSVAIARPASL